MRDGPGRPTVMTEETVNKLEQAFSLGASDREACFYAGISHQTLYDYQHKNPDFIERKAALKEKLILKARTVVASAMEQGDKQTAQWYLERKKKEEFSPKYEQEVKGDIDHKHSGDITLQILQHIPSEQLEQILAEKPEDNQG